MTNPPINLHYRKKDRHPMPDLSQIDTVEPLVLDQTVSPPIIREMRGTDPDNPESARAARELHAFQNTGKVRMDHGTGDWLVEPAGTGGLRVNGALVPVMGGPTQLLQANRATMVAGSVTVDCGDLLGANTVLQYSRESSNGGSMGHLDASRDLSNPGHHTFTITSTSGTEVSTISFSLVEPF